MNTQNAHSSQSNQTHSMSEILEKLSELNTDNPVDCCNNLNDLLTKNITRCITDSNFKIEDIPKLVEEVHHLNPDDDSIEWIYICLNFYYFSQLRDIFAKNFEDACFSVQETVKLENVLRNVIGIAVSSNLHPKLPYYTLLPSKAKNSQSVSVFVSYKRLLAVTYGFYTILISFAHLRSILISKYLKWILCGFYQILYGPIAKPSSSADSTGFVMTEEIFNSLQLDRRNFQKFFLKLIPRIHPIVYVRETMMLSDKNSPPWLKKAVFVNLSEFVVKKNGVESLAWALLDATEADEKYDVTKSWNALDVLSKIIAPFIRLPSSRKNICGQLSGLLKLRDSSGKSIHAFERLYTLCIKLLSQEDALVGENALVNNLLDSLLCYTKPEFDILEDEPITESISQTMRMLRNLVVEDTFNSFLIPFSTIHPAGDVIFKIFSVTSENGNLKELNEDIRVLLLKLLQESDVQFELLDRFLFDFPCKNCLNLQSNINFYIQNNDLYAKKDEFGVKLVPTEILRKIIINSSCIKTSLFTYLFNCLVKQEKYFKRSNTDLLDLETEFILDEVSERKIIVFQLLSELAEDKAIQNHIINNPSTFISYMDDVLMTNISNKVHMLEDSESEDFQILFLMVMILQALINITPKENLAFYIRLEGNLDVVLKECKNSELKTLIQSVLLLLTEGKIKKFTFNDSDDSATSKTELDKAIEDVCDPLLPIRGHGLMTLTKLIKTRDKNALERKRFICNIFQNTLKDDDSFIYLSAIGGLAAMGEIFPNTILTILTEEYTDFSKHAFENNQETRLKLGEVLVGVTKLLGEMAPKYKALLLNAFLFGIKDDDYLIRASSLSNLGEICRILGYKLGTAITEVLSAVHAIIATDKAPEARRAAVMVLRQLFVGLEKEMIVFLKDEILSIYRTLKMIYSNDSDDVMRLQAQLALEQLNENTKDFLLPLIGLNAVNRFVLPTEKEINVKIKFK